MAWYRKAEWMASRTTSLPRNENERLLTPPQILTPGQAALICRVASMKLTAVVVVLLDAGGDGEDVGVEDDVRRVDADLLGQQPVGALADRDLALDGVGLALSRRRPSRPSPRRSGGTSPRLGEEVGFAFLEADRVDDAPCPART